MNREDDNYIEILKNTIANNLAKKEKSEFEKPEDVLTSNIGHGDIINQINNVGHNINDKVDGSSGVTHQKLDEIVKLLQASKGKDATNEFQNNLINYYGLLNEIKDIKTENKIISNNLTNAKTENALRYENFEKQNNNIKSTITLIVSVFSIIITVLFAVINLTIGSINKNIDSLEKNNSMQIQRDVAIEIKNQQNRK